MIKVEILHHLGHLWTGLCNWLKKERLMNKRKNNYRNYNLILLQLDARSHLKLILNSSSLKMSIFRDEKMLINNYMHWLRKKKKQWQRKWKLEKKLNLIRQLKIAHSSQTYSRQWRKIHNSNQNKRSLILVTNQ